MEGGKVGALVDHRGMDGGTVAGMDVGSGAGVITGVVAGVGVAAGVRARTDIGAGVCASWDVSNFFPAWIHSDVEWRLTPSKNGNQEFTHRTCTSRLEHLTVTTVT
jgi:hypothetical protein